MDNHKRSATPSVWRRQMQFSGGAVVAGMLLLAYCIPQLRHVEGVLPHSMVILSVVGGLMVLGGGFSCALALFFHLWHKKADD